MPATIRAPVSCTHSECYARAFNARPTHGHLCVTGSIGVDTIIDSRPTIAEWVQRRHGLCLFHIRKTTDISAGQALKGLHFG